MYNQEARKTIKSLNYAIDVLSNAQRTIQMSESHTSADIEVSNVIYAKACEIREVRNMIRDLYPNMNE